METTSNIPKAQHKIKNAKMLMLPETKSVPKIPIELINIPHIKLHKNAQGITKIHIKTIGFKRFNFCLTCFLIITKFIIVVMLMHSINPKINASTLNTQESPTTHKSKATPPIMLFLNDLTSKLKVFKMLLVMLESPKGNITQALLER